MPDKKTRECSACKVGVSNDLSFCPVCGKYLLLNDGDKIELNDATFPNYDYTYINRGKWIRNVRNLLFSLGLICFFINILFVTQPFWFPYCIASLIFVYWTIFEPFKYRNNFLRYLVRIAFFCALFLIFIDYYAYKTVGSVFGWSLAYVAPAVMSGFTVLIGVLGLSTRKYDVMHFYGALIMVLLSGLYLVLRMMFFDFVPAWPTLMFVCSSVVVTLILFTFKYKKVFKDMHKRFHI